MPVEGFDKKRLEHELYCQRHSVCIHLNNACCFEDCLCKQYERRIKAFDVIHSPYELSKHEP